MTKWHYYVTRDGTGYWSLNPPFTTRDDYIAYVYAAQQPTGGPHQSNYPSSLMHSPEG
jgi:hypothetical protein